MIRDVNCITHEEMMTIQKALFNAHQEFTMELSVGNGKYVHRDARFKQRIDELNNAIDVLQTDTQTTETDRR